MAKFKCCEVDFKSLGELNEHVKAIHGAQAYRTELSCCGMPFNTLPDLKAHVRDVHKAGKYDLEL